MATGLAVGEVAGEAAAVAQAESTGGGERSPPAIAS